MSVTLDPKTILAEQISTDDPTPEFASLAEFLARFAIAVTKDKDFKNANAKDIVANTLQNFMADCDKAAQPDLMVKEGNPYRAMIDSKEVKQYLNNWLKYLREAEVDDPQDYKESILYYMEDLFSGIQINAPELTDKVKLLENFYTHGIDALSDCLLFEHAELLQAGFITEFEAPLSTAMARLMRSAITGNLTKLAAIKSTVPDSLVIFEHLNGGQPLSRSYLIGDKSTGPQNKHTP